MKRLFIVTVSLLIVSVLIFSACPAPTSAQAKTTPKQLTMSTCSTASGAYGTYTTMAKVIMDRHSDKIAITLREAPGSTVEQQALLVKGEVDIAWCDDSVQYALTGSTFMGKEYHYAPDIRVLFMAQANPVTYFALAETGINSIYDLEGKPFGISYPASSTGREVRKVFGGLNINVNGFEADIATCVQATKDRRIVGFAKPGCPDAVILEVAATAPINILGLSKDDLAKIGAEYPIVPDLIPAGSYPGQAEDIWSTATMVNVSVLKDFSDDLAWYIVDSVWKGRHEIGAAYAAINREMGILGFPEFTFQGSPGPLHPGAVKWYKDNGYSVPGHLIPPEMK